MRIAALIYDRGQSQAVDALFATAAARLAGEGCRVAGVVQLNEGEAGSRCARMVLQELTTRRVFDISICQQPGEEGCSLNPPAVEDVAGLVQSTLDEGAQLLIVNRFGKLEVAGSGFRGLIETAVADDIPVMVAINETYKSDWLAFAGPDVPQLGADLESIVAWCRTNVRGASVAREVLA